MKLFQAIGGKTGMRSCFSKQKTENGNFLLQWTRNSEMLAVIFKGKGILKKKKRRLLLIPGFEIADGRKHFSPL